MRPNCVHGVSTTGMITTGSLSRIFIVPAQGGGRGIRTLGEVAPSAVFKTAAIGH
jgi:hypothetical protein